MKKKLSVLMIPTSNSGVSFYRFYNYWPAAYRTGSADFHVLWWQKDNPHMAKWQFDLNDNAHVYRITREMQDWAIKADVIIFQMLHTYNGLELFRAVKELVPHVPILTEIDDNMASTPIYNAADPYYTPGSEMREVALKQFKESDGMIVSTPYLKSDVYAELNDNIHVVPNCLDFDIWSKVRHKSRPGIRIGWAGGASHDKDLEILEKVIPKIVERHKEVKFVFVHGLPHNLRNLPGVEYIPRFTRIDKYPNFLASLDFDIGIAPLVDNAFNRGKSNLRWLEYSGLKIPTVASRVGHFKETINDGVDGLLASTPEEWEKYLEYLIVTKEYRKKMGLTAFQRVFGEFNTDVVVKSYVGALELVIEKKQLQPAEVMA